MSDRQAELVERARRVTTVGLRFAATSEARSLPAERVRYREELADGPRLDLYRSAEAAAALRPAWLFVHGGPLPPSLPHPLAEPLEWRLYRDYGELAVAAGRIGVVVGHRYRSLDELSVSAADLRAAIDWTREHADELGVDPDRLAIWLFSGAGLHLPALLADPPPGVRSVVAFYPAVDVEAMIAMGAGVESATARAAVDVWPQAGASTPRLFVARAGLDHPSLLAGLDRFVARAIEANLAVEVVTHPAGHHGFDVLDSDPRGREIAESALRFLVRGESPDEPVPALRDAAPPSGE